MALKILRYVQQNQLKIIYNRQSAHRRLYSENMHMENPIKNLNPIDEGVEAKFKKVDIAVRNRAGSQKAAVLLANCKQNASGRIKKIFPTCEIVEVQRT